MPGAHILVLVPQRALASPYFDILRSPEAVAGGQVSVLTAGGLARRMVDLFWPLISRQAGFAHPEKPPAFLTLETAQYYMAHLVRPLLSEGLFESVSIDRNRLYSQVLDNLNKAALTGFPHTQIAERLSGAWSGETSQLRVFADAQRCASLFRWLLPGAQPAGFFAAGGNISRPAAAIPAVPRISARLRPPRHRRQY